MIEQQYSPSPADSFLFLATFWISSAHIGNPDFGKYYDDKWSVDEFPYEKYGVSARVIEEIQIFLDARHIGNGIAYTLEIIEGEMGRGRSLSDLTEYSVGTWLNRVYKDY